MHRLYVRPPEGDLVDTFLLSRSIAHAIIALAAEPHAAITEGLLDSKVADIKVHDADMQTIAPLDVEDRKLLREILPDLPPLAITSNAGARADFLKQWEMHSKAPTWRPYLPTEQDQALATFQSLDISSRHLNQIQEWLSREKLQAFDRHRIPAMKAGLGIYITREDAERYLKEHGMDVAAPTLKTLDEPLTSGAVAKAEGCKTTHHSADMQPRNTVDSLINALIKQNIETLSAETDDATILDQVIAMFVNQSETAQLLDFQSCRGHGGNFEIHRKNDSPLKRSAIRTRIVRARAKNRHTGTE
jgi:hypothetical protein